VNHSDKTPADEHAFDDVCRVIRGERRIALGRSAKMLRIVLGTGNTDMLSDRARFVVEIHERRRRPLQDFRRLAPAVVSELLIRTSMDAVFEPTVVGMPAGTVPATLENGGWSYPNKLVWFVPTTTSLKVIVRDATYANLIAATSPIPLDGPLALRELPSWAPPIPVYRDFDPPFVCPNCRLACTRFRELGGALICSGCGRSFSAPTA